MTDRIKVRSFRSPEMHWRNDLLPLGHWEAQVVPTDPCVRHYLGFDSKSNQELREAIQQVFGAPQPDALVSYGWTRKAAIRRLTRLYAEVERDAYMPDVTELVTWEPLSDGAKPDPRPES